jgi:hypothetical protein
MEEVLRAVDPLRADWVALLVLALVGMLGWINLVSPKKWRLLGTSLVSLRLGRQTMRDDLDLQDRTLVVLLMMASASIALVVHQFAVLLLGGAPHAGHWAKCLGVVLLIVAALFMVNRLTAFLAMADVGLTEHLYGTLLLLIALGIALLPLAAVVAWPYQPGWRMFALWTALGITALFIGWRWVRAAVIGMAEGVPLRYIFVYLCALEILPVVILGQRLIRSVALASTTP